MKYKRLSFDQDQEQSAALKRSTVILIILICGELAAYEWLSIAPMIGTFSHWGSRLV